MNSLRVMTYNIRLGIQQGPEAIGAIIQRAAPDVVALQEVGKHWSMGPQGDTAQEIADILGWPHVLYVNTIEQQGHRYGHALLSRHGFTQSRQLALPQHRDEPRALLSAQLNHAPSPVILSTHLSHLKDERPAQAKVLVAQAREHARLGDPVIILGDLNAHHDTPWLRALTQDFQDADAQRARLTFPSHDPKVRLDYLLTHGGSWSDPDVIEDSEASDHFALCATWTPTNA